MRLTNKLSTTLKHPASKLQPEESLIFFYCLYYNGKVVIRLLGGSGSVTTTYTLHRDKSPMIPELRYLIEPHSSDYCTICNELCFDGSSHPTFHRRKQGFTTEFKYRRVQIHSFGSNVPLVS